MCYCQTVTVWRRRMLDPKRLSPAMLSLTQNQVLESHPFWIQLRTLSSKQTAVTSLSSHWWCTLKISGKYASECSFVCSCMSVYKSKGDEGVVVITCQHPIVVLAALTWQEHALDMVQCRRLQVVEGFVSSEQVRDYFAQVAHAVC